MNCNFEEEPFGTDTLTMDQAFTDRVDRDLAGTADRAAVFLAGDFFVADTALVLYGVCLKLLIP